MSSDWQKMALGELAKVRAGYGFPKCLQGMTEGKYPFAKVSDVSAASRTPGQLIDAAKNYVGEPERQALRAKPIPPSSILFAKIGEAIRKNYRVQTRREMLIDNNVGAIVPNQTVIDAEFLTAFLKTIDFYEIASGTTVPAIKKTGLEKLEVPVPPLDEQRRIVGRIREAMERVDELRRLRSETVVAAHALLPSLLKEVFDKVVADTAAAQPLGSIIEETKYGTSQKCSPNVDGLPILRIPNIEVGTIDLTNMKYLPWEDADVEKLTLRRGDLLLVRTNGSPDLVGRCAVFDLEGTFGYASYLIRIRPNPEVALPRYLAYYLASTAGRDQIAKRRRTSAGQFNINSSNLKTISIPVPTMTRQQDLVRHMDEIRNSVLATLQQQLDSQRSEAALPAAILRKAFAGEL